MILRLQNGSKEAVAAMNNGRDQANESLGQAKLAGESLEKITTAVEGMLGMNTEIAQASNEQGQSVSEVSENVASINQLSSQTANSSNVMTDTSHQVSDLAIKLQQLMSQFKV